MEVRSMRKERGAVDGKPAEVAPVLKKGGAVGATPAAKDGEAELRKKVARLERASGDLQATAGSRLERRREGRIGAPEETFLLIRDIAELKGEVARLEKANIGLQVFSAFAVASYIAPPVTGEIGGTAPLIVATAEFYSRTSTI